ncbi:MAG: hypothetical protein ACFHXK_17020 [bacterium]
MLVKKGKWLGKGKLLVGGSSLGVDLNVDLDITEDEGGITLNGNLEGEFTGAVSIRIAPDEVGTYVIDARIAGMAFDGVSKLESEPNLALLWHAGHTSSVSVALFQAGGGIGCRGFWQEGGKTATWEILFQLKQHVVGGDNVVSLRRRRR